MERGASKMRCRRKLSLRNGRPCAPSPGRGHGRRRCRHDGTPACFVRCTCQMRSWLHLDPTCQLRGDAGRGRTVTDRTSSAPSWRSFLRGQAGGAHGRRWCRNVHRLRAQAHTVRLHASHAPSTARSSPRPVVSPTAHPSLAARHPPRAGGSTAGLEAPSRRAEAPRADGT
jgi:hypothetical protein